MTTQARIGVAIAVWILLPIAAAAGPSPGQDSAVLQHAQGGEYTGHVTGSCHAAGLRLRQDEPATLALNLTEGRFALVETWVNSTRASAHPDIPFKGLAVEDDQRRTVKELAPGTLDVSWTSAAAFLEPRSQSSDLRFAFDSARVVARDVRGSLATTKYPLLLGENVFWIAMALEGPLRVVESEQEAWRGHGEFRLYFHEARLEGADGWSFAMPPFHQVESWTGASENVSYRSDLWTYGELEGTADVIMASRSQADLACRGAEFEVDGGAVFHHASGAVQKGGEEIRFETEDLAASGRFALVETMHEDWAPSGYVESRLEGELRSVSLDFAAVVVPNDPSLLVQVGFWSLLAAAVGTLVWGASKVSWGLFSRLSGPQVAEHGSRRRLLEVVEASPNINLRTLAAAAGLSKSEVRYHARILEQRGLLRSHKVGRDRCFVAHSTLRSEGRQLLAPSVDVWARNDPALGLVVQSIAPGGTRQNLLMDEVRARLGLSKWGAWKAVARAESHGFVRRVQRGREVWVEPMRRVAYTTRQ